MKIVAPLGADPGADISATVPRGSSRRRCRRESRAPCRGKGETLVGRLRTGTIRTNPTHGSLRLSRYADRLSGPGKHLATAEFSKAISTDILHFRARVLVIQVVMARNGRRP